MLKRILVPLDGSGLAERALTYATALFSQTGAHIVLLRATLAHTVVGVDPRERQTGAIQEATQYLDQVADRIRQRGYTCETVVRFGHAAERITESARTREVDLIVMATHGRTGPGRWMFGSTAEAVVATSPVPVLVQRAWQPLFGELVNEHQTRLIWRRGLPARPVTLAVDEWQLRAPTPSTSQQRTRPPCDSPWGSRCCPAWEQGCSWS